MPRPSIVKNISTGILTLQNVATILGVSSYVAKKWITDNKVVHTYPLSARQEMRVSPISLLENLRKHRMPTPREIVMAAQNFLKNFRQDMTPISCADDAEIDALLAYSVKNHGIKRLPEITQAIEQTEAASTVKDAIDQPNRPSFTLRTSSDKSSREQQAADISDDNPELDDRELEIPQEIVIEKPIPSHVKPLNPRNLSGESSGSASPLMRSLALPANNSKQSPNFSVGLADEEDIMDDVDPEVRDFLQKKNL